MGFIIKATNLETKEEVLYARKSQKFKYIEGIKYKYYVPVVDLDLRVYTDIPHCNMALAFLQEQFKQPFQLETGEVEWRVIWEYEILEVEKSEYDE